MKKILITLLYLSISWAMAAQITEANASALRKELAKNINQLRIDKGLSALKQDPILEKAAKNQSAYMAQFKELKHRQLNPDLASPRKRVEYFNGIDFDLVGENVLQTKPESLPLMKARITSIAKEMFEAWRNSPGHYANMINPDYVYGDIAFQYSTQEGIIYATQVFGRKGTKIKGQLSTDEFGLTEYEDDCTNLFGIADNLIANMGNTMRIEGNKVMFYYHNRDYLNNILTSNNDGFAVDLVFKGQFECNKPNQLDLSPIYDGILLKPVYKDELLRNNTAQSDYRIISQIGVIPESLLQKEVSISVILIKNGKKCKYLVPGSVPSKSYPLKPINIKLLNPENVDLIKSGIIESQELEYTFNTGIPTPIKYPLIKPNKRPVHSVEVNCFSSVEGDAARNALLHDKRAQNIKKHILKKRKGETYPIAIEAKENWDKMYFQLKYFFAGELIAQPKDSIKALLASEDDRLPWDSLLFNQRKATATIHYKGVLTDDPASYDKLLVMNLKTALHNQNFDLANKALFEIYYGKYPLSNILFEESIFTAIMQYPELTQNASAVLSKYHYVDRSEVTTFLFHWLTQEALLSEEAKVNLLNLYTIVSQDLQYTWDLPAKRLANVIHPATAQRIMSEELESDLVLNLNLIFIRYFGQINDGRNINKSFNFIARYFRKRALNLEDEINLALFFNSWSRFDLTNKNLLAKYYDDKLDEDGLFLLMKTLSFYNEKGFDLGYYDDVYTDTYESNPERWCYWADREFQILRDDDLKEFYCNRCNN